MYPQNRGWAAHHGAQKMEQDNPDGYVSLPTMSFNGLLHAAAKTAAFFCLLDFGVSR